MNAHQIADALIALEQQAAVVGRLLEDADEAMLDQVAAAWAPLRPLKQPQTRWQRFWLDWLRDCAERLPAAACDGEQPDLHYLLVNWCCRT